MMLEDPYEYEPQRITMSPYWALIAIVLGAALAMALWSAGVRADPIAKAAAENGAVITLFNEPCDIREQVTNLPLRATWEEAGKTFKGCWGPRPDLGAAVFFFDDKTVGVIPFQALRRVVGT